MLLPVAAFGIMALVGLLAALRPRVFMEYFLADYQRERLWGNMGLVSQIGWFLFGCSTFMFTLFFLGWLIRR